MGAPVAFAVWRRRAWSDRICRAARHALAGLLLATLAATLCGAAGVSAGAGPAPLRFRRLVTELSLGPSTGDMALRFADGSGEVLWNGRVSRHIATGVSRLVWIPGTSWVLLQRHSAYTLAQADGGASVVLPFCASAFGVPVHTAGVSYWCAGVLHVVAVPPLDSAASAMPVRTAYRMAAAHPSPGPAPFAIDPSHGLVAVAGANGVQVYALARGTPVAPPLVAHGVTALSWSSLGGLAVATTSGVTLLSSPDSAGTARVYAGMQGVRDLQWLPNGSAALALRAGQIGPAGAPLYALDLLAASGPPTAPDVVLQGRLGYVLGLSTDATSLWREEGVSAAVWSGGPAAAGIGPFTLRQVPIVGIPLSAVPAACGPVATPTSAAQAAAAADVPTSPAALDTPLPVSGGPVPYGGMAVAGRTLFVAGWSEHSLFATADGGSQWHRVATPPLPGGITGLALSPDGGTLAVQSHGFLYLLDHAARQALASSPPAWRRIRLPAPVDAMAFDPSDRRRLVMVGGTTGRSGQVSLYISDHTGRSLRAVPLPVHPGIGPQLVLSGGAAYVVISPGWDRRPALFRVPLAPGATPAALPTPPRALAPVRGVAAGPHGTLYLAAANGLYALAAHGAQWRTLSLPSGRSGAVAAARGALYLAEPVQGQTRIWRSSPPGSGWTIVGNSAITMYSGLWPDGDGLWLGTAAGPAFLGPSGQEAVLARGIPARVDLVASATADPLHVAASDGATLYVSTDGGRTFTARTPPTPAGAAMSSFGWTNGGGCLDLLYGADGTPPLAFLSGDAGRNWYALPLPDGMWPNAGLVESPPGSGVWWAAAAGTLQCYDPAWQAWRTVPLPPAVPPPGLLAAAGARYLWIGGTNGAFGAWRLALPPHTSDVCAALAGAATPHRLTAAWGAGGAYQGLAADPYQGSLVYAGVRRTADSGAAWSVVRDGPPYSWQGMDALAFDPAVRGAVLTWNNQLLHDDGGIWVPVWTAPTAGEAVTGVAVAGPGRFYAAIHNVGLEVLDVGRAMRWHAPAPPTGYGRWTAPPPRPQPAPSPPLLAAAPSQPQTVYRATYGMDLAASGNGGRTFSALPMPTGPHAPIPFGSMHPFIASLTVSPANPDRIYLAANYSTRQGQAGLWTSADGGRTWTATGLQDVAVTSVAAVPSRAGVILAVVNGFTVYRSTDGGATWQVLRGIAGDVVTTPGAGEVLVGGTDAVWASHDAGRMFTKLSLGPAWAYATVHALLQVPGDTLYAGTDRGLAVSADGRRTWSDVSEAVGDPPINALTLLPGGDIAVATPAGTFTYRP